MNRNSRNDKKLRGKSRGSKASNLSPDSGLDAPSSSENPRRSGPGKSRPNLKFKGGTNARKSYGKKQPQISGDVRKPGTNSKRRTPRAETFDREGWIWGAHAARAVLENPKRTIHRALISQALAGRWGINPEYPMLGAHELSIVHPRDIDALLGDTAHQGVAVKAAPLPQPDLSDILAQDAGTILVLDQVTDPHNVGAMFRLCAAFGVTALVMQSRHAPPLTGATAKVAVGTIETVPCISVTNIANTLLEMQKQFWTVTGLAGETDLTLAEAMTRATARRALVMGAEGPGLRPRVRDCCDQLARIPMPGGNAESLNVSTAAAIAIYEACRDVK